MDDVNGYKHSDCHDGSVKCYIALWYSRLYKNISKNICVFVPQSSDTEDELEMVCAQARLAGAFDVVRCTHWAEGGAGAAALGKAVQRAAEVPHPFKFLYPLEVKTSISTRYVIHYVYVCLQWCICHWSNPVWIASWINCWFAVFFCVSVSICNFFLCFIWSQVTKPTDWHTICKEIITISN